MTRSHEIAANCIGIRLDSVEEIDRINEFRRGERRSTHQRAGWTTLERESTSGTTRCANTNDTTEIEQHTRTAICYQMLPRQSSLQPISSDNCASARANSSAASRRTLDTIWAAARAPDILDMDDLHRDEVIDSAFAAALSRLEQGQPIRDLAGFLRARAQDVITREVRRVQQERRRFVSLDQTISSGEDGDGGEEVHVGDVIPDPASRGPEQIAIDNETLNFLISVLADVPDMWRTVFLQRTMQERSARDVAELEGLAIDEVRRITVLTRDYLRERMEEEYELFEVDDLFRD